MARETMGDLIAHLRNITGARTDDEYLGQTFWSDEQLQAVLDTRRLHVRDTALVPRSYVRDGVTLKNEQFFHAGFPWIEAVFEVHTLAGALVDEDSYTVDLGQKCVIFDLDVNTDTPYYIDFYHYDMNQAAADVWETKASHRFDFINMKAGVNHKFDFKAEYDHCIDMRNYYRSRKVRAFSHSRRGFTV